MCHAVIYQPDREKKNRWKLEENFLVLLCPRCKGPIYTTEKLATNQWKKWYGPHNFSLKHGLWSWFTTGWAKRRLRTKFGRLRLHYYLLGTAPSFSMRQRYCSGDQRNYYTSWNKNEETGPDPGFFGIRNVFGPKAPKHTGLCISHSTWYV